MLLHSRRSAHRACKLCLAPRQGLTIPRNLTTRAKLISASLPRLRRRSAFERAARKNQFRFFILPGTFRRAVSTSLRARIARPEFIQALLAEASRFANALRRFKAASGLSALLSRRLHWLARLRRQSFATTRVRHGAPTTCDPAPGCWIQTL